MSDKKSICRLYRELPKLNNERKEPDLKMDRRLEWTFLQRKYAHKYVLSIANYWRYENQLQSTAILSEHMPAMREALSSIPRTTEGKKKKDA